VFNEMNGAGGFNKAASDAHRFMMQLRDLSITFEVFGAKVLDALQNKLGLNLDKVQRWMMQHGDHLADQLIDGIERLWKVADYLATKFGELVGWLQKLDAATGGWSTKLLVIAALLKVSGAGSIIGGVLSFGAALATLGPVGWTVAAALAAAAVEMTAIYKLSQMKPADRSNLLKSILGFALTPGALSDLAAKWGAGKAADWLKTRGIRNNNPGNLRFAGQAGATNTGGFAQWATPQEGLYNLARQLELYSKRGANTISSILSRYAPAGENDLPAYISDVSKRIGMGAGAHLNMQDPQTLQRLMSAIIMHENGRNGYSDAMQGAAAKRAIVNITQHNDFNNYGGDSTAISGQVLRQQQRLNADITRTAAAAIQ